MTGQITGDVGPGRTIFSVHNASRAPVAITRELPVHGDVRG